VVRQRLFSLNATITRPLELKPQFVRMPPGSSEQI
jgi:hypothetical protein